MPARSPNNTSRAGNQFDNISNAPENDTADPDIHNGPGSSYAAASARNARSRNGSELTEANLMEHTLRTNIPKTAREDSEDWHTRIVNWIDGVERARWGDGRGGQ